MEKNIEDEIILVSNSLEIQSSAVIRGKLVVLLNDLINKDFGSVIQLLYRIDVNEKKVRAYLNENKNKNTATILADLIIERQLQKIASRKNYQSKHDDTSKEEKW